MKKQLKLGGNKIEITISAQAYLPPPPPGFDQRTSLHASLNALLHDRRFAISATLNNFPLFGINSIEEIDLRYYIEIVEDVCEKYLNDYTNSPAHTLDGYLNEIGYKV